MRYALLGVLLLSFPSRAHAEWQIKPFAGLTFGGGTNLLGNREDEVGKRKSSIGISAAMVGEVLGIEGDVSYGAGFFDDAGQALIAKSGLTTVTGNLIVALPRRISEYTLRPYFVVGTGVIRASTTTSPTDVFELHRSFPAFDMGLGVTGFVGPRFGVSWDVRHFRNLQGRTGQGSTIDGLAERFSFWRANMALAIRY